MKILVTLFFTLWSMTTFANSTLIEGLWLAENKSTHVEISQTEPGRWQGVVTSDPLKPELEGTQLLSAIVEAPDGYEGKVYAIKKAKHYDAEIKPMDSTLQIEVTAGFFSKTIIWTRIE
ncbi:DUF2147 domain-containing protein [Vibrio methylphosphonaticus]|uniref:DUF2147 domain-containing protein n=1 Tax=Vibrio methylphosphonaticus TaxID=2946866 RepID=UPI00202A26A2|nr:DUF2147 domain-containing protein [Vibrio methylphosphonaticus]MCL9773801.1 DUF2147 domain-containing protein [Vibrio methylphosphonaticus]